MGVSTLGLQDKYGSTLPRVTGQVWEYPPRGHRPSMGVPTPGLEAKHGSTLPGVGAGNDAQLTQQIHF